MEVLDCSDLRWATLTSAKLRGAKLRAANLTGAHLHKTDLTEVNLEAANLERGTLVEVNLMGAVLTGCRVYGVSAWDLTLDEYTTHASLIITRRGEAEVIVDDLEVAQFIYLLLNHRKLRNVLNSVTKRGVLILGRFGDGDLQVLQAVAAKLRQIAKHGVRPSTFLKDRDKGNPEMWHRGIQFLRDRRAAQMSSSIARLLRVTDSPFL